MTRCLPPSHGCILLLTPRSLQRFLESSFSWVHSTLVLYNSDTPLKMATALPPRKRLKAIDTRATLPTPVVAAPKPVELVVIQFTDDKGNNVGPRVQLPADAPRQALEMLVNKLGGNVRF